jgi:hypothetical protein
LRTQQWSHSSMLDKSVHKVRRGIIPIQKDFGTPFFWFFVPEMFTHLHIHAYQKCSKDGIYCNCQVIWDISF